MPTVLPLPPNAPKVKASPRLQKMSAFMLRRLGWRMEGEWPDVKKMVVIAAPHSSAWDVVIGLLVMQACGVRFVFMGKQEAFVGPLGSLLRHFGGIPVNRAQPGGIIEQVVDQINKSERIWFALSPEGTRKVVENWKTGFWKIAKQANVPVCCAYFHFPEKVLGVGPLVELSEDMQVDIEKIRAWYKPYQGKNRGV